MYLHIGNNKNVRIQEIIGIFDLDSASIGTQTKQFLRKKEKDGMVSYATEDLPKSFLLMEDGIIHFSQISTGALAGRMIQNDGI